LEFPLPLWERVVSEANRVRVIDSLRPEPLTLALSPRGEGNRPVALLL
jgi:hypothetical protein